MRRKGKTIMFAACLVTVAGCTQSQHQVRESGQAKWARSARGSNKKIPAYNLPKILPQTHFAAARLLEKQGLADDAIAQYQKVIALNHGFVAAYHRLGTLFSATGRHAEATAALRNAVALAPNHAVLRNDLGAELMFREHWAGAEHEFRKATELMPEFARAHVNCGIALTRLGRFEEAKHSFKTVLPEPDALYNLGLMYRGQKRFAEAAQTFREVLELDPDFMAARMQLDQVADFAVPATTTEFVGPRAKKMQRITALNTDHTRDKSMNMAAKSLQSSAPFDVNSAQRRREQESRSKQTQASRKPKLVTREHVADYHHAPASVTAHRDSHVTRDNDKADGVEKLAPMLKYFRPKVQAEMQKQRQAQMEAVVQRQASESTPSGSPWTKDNPASSYDSLAQVFPFDSPCDTEELWPGDREDFEALVDAEIRSGAYSDATWPMESFLPATMSSQIIPKLWSEADETPAHHTTSVTYSIGQGVDRHEIEALVAVEGPCRDMINEDASTLQKFAVVQRVHQVGLFDGKSFTVDHDGMRKPEPEPVSQRLKRPHQRSMSVSPAVKSRAQDKPIRNQAHQTPGYSTIKPKPTKSSKHPRASADDKADQTRFARRASKRESPSVRKSVTQHSSNHDWQDCLAQPGVASAAIFNPDQVHTDSINVRLTLREHERALERLRDEIRCLDYTLAEREMVASSVEDDVYFGAVMFGAGWQIPGRESSVGSRLFSPEDVSYVPTAPGFPSHDGMLPSDFMAAPNRRSTMSSVVMPRRHVFTSAMGYDDQPYVQDYELQMSMPATWYTDRVIGFDDDPSVHWSLDPSIMDAPLEVLINETNCWQHDGHRSEMIGVPTESQAPFASVDGQFARDAMSSQYADVRRRERVRKEVKKDNDDQKKNRFGRRNSGRRPWFKP